MKFKDIEEHAKLDDTTQCKSLKLQASEGAENASPLFQFKAFFNKKDANPKMLYEILKNHSEMPKWFHPKCSQSEEITVEN